MVKNKGGNPLSEEDILVRIEKKLDLLLDFFQIHPDTGKPTSTILELSLRAKRSVEKWRAKEAAKQKD